MIRIIELPQVGESVTEGVIGKWLVEPGQHVEKYDPLVEVVTDKVSMEAPSPYTGVFVRALAREGETVPMGQPICEMEVESDEPAPLIPAEAGTQGPLTDGDVASEESAEEAQELEGEGEGDSEDGDDAGRVGGAWAMPAAHGADPQAEGQGEEAAQHAFEFMDSVRSVGPTGSGERGEGRPDALQEQALAEHAQYGAHESADSSAAEPDRRHVISPLVARLSAQYGIDLSTLQGTGTGGRITSKDLLEAVNRLSAPAQEETAEEEASEEPQAVAEAAPEDAKVSPLLVEEGEGEGIAAAEADTEAASPVIPAPAGIQGARAAHAEEVGPVEGLEAEAGTEETVEEVTEEEEEALGEEGVEDVEEALDEAEEEEAGLGAVAVEEEDTEPAPVPVIPASIPVIPAEAGIQEPPADEDAATGEAVAPAPLSLQGERAGERVPWGGVVEDVEEEAAVEEPAPAQPAAEDTSVMPLTPVRRIIAEHMARSSREIPAAWSMVETDVTRLVRTRDALKAAFEEKHGVPLTYLPFAASAVAAALREHPRLNARWDDGHITLNNRVNLAVAVSTEAGLMVPVLHDADTLTIAGIAAELRRLSEGARAGTLGIEDVEGGTFTLNNTGALGSVVSVPIINHPQAAIMTTEAIVKRPVVVEGDAIAVRSMMNLCITFDHRVCDGAEAAAFLSAVKARLEVIDESIGLG